MNNEYRYSEDAIGLMEVMEELEVTLSPQEVLKLEKAFLKMLMSGHREILNLYDRINELEKELKKKA